MFFVVMCFDRPGSSQVRADNIPAHLRYLEQQGPKVHTGGPLKHPDTGALLGSLYIIDVESYEAARRFIEDEPLQKAGLFESTIVRGWMQMQPEIEPGANEATAKEFERQLKESRA